MATIISFIMGGLGILAKALPFILSLFKPKVSTEQKLGQQEVRAEVATKATESLNQARKEKEQADEKTRTSSDADIINRL